MNLQLGNSTNFMSEIVNPFSKDGIENIWIWITKGSEYNKHTAPDGMVYEATIAFKNGKTEGKQKIHGNSFSDLVKKIEAEIQNLSN